jgi:hypothetical protein
MRGKKLRCTGCKKKFVVGAEPMPDAAKELEPVRTSEPAVVGQQEVGEKSKQCPSCGEMVGQEAVKCRCCGEPLQEYRGVKFKLPVLKLRVLITVLLVGMVLVVIAEVMRMSYDDPEGRVRGYTVGAWICSPIIRLGIYSLCFAVVTAIAGLAKRKKLVAFSVFAWLFFAAGIWDIFWVPVHASRETKLKSDAGKLLRSLQPWQKVTIPEVGTIDIPSAMEVKSGVPQLLGEYGACIIGLMGPNEPLHPNVIIRTRLGHLGDYQRLHSRFAMSRDELREITEPIRQQFESEKKTHMTDELKALKLALQNMSNAQFREFLKERGKEMGVPSEEVERDVERMADKDLESMRRQMLESFEQGFQKVDTLRVLNWLPPALKEVNGVLAIYVSFRRQSAGEPPVFSEAYGFQNYDRMHWLFVSYRESEKQMWEKDLTRVVASFRITNIR